MEAKKDNFLDILEFQQEYKGERMLGSGAYAQVTLTRRRKTNTTAVIKIVSE